MSDAGRPGRRRRRRGAGRFGPAPRWVRWGVLGALILLIAALVAANLRLTERRDGGGRTGREYNVARLALGAVDLDVALREGRAAVAAEPGSREARLLLALVLQRRGATTEARTILRDDVARDRGYDDGRVLLAAFAMREEDYAAALALLREAVERDPTPPDAWRLLAEIRALTGDRDGATAAYARAVDGAPDDLRSWLGLGDVQLAAALDTGSVVARQEAGRAYREAEQLSRRALRHGGGRTARRALAKALAGRARALRGSSFDEAAAEIEKLVADAGDDEGPTLVQAAFLSGVGRDGDARRLLEKAERRWPSPAVRGALAGVLESMGEGSEAAAVLRRALAADARDGASRAALVALLTRSGRLEEASTALGDTPGDVAMRGRIDEAAGDLARVRSRAAAEAGDEESAGRLRAAALDAYGRALTERPRSMPLQKKRFSTLLEGAAAAPDALGAADLAAARAFVDDVLELNPGDADALAWRARLALLDGEPETAFERLAPAATGDAPTTEVLRLFGAACERTGRDTQAADAFQRVLARLTHRDVEARRDDRAAPPDAWADAIRTTLRLGRAGLAAARAAEGVAAWPDALGLRLLLADSLVVAGRDEDALAALEAAATRFASSSAVLVRMAAVHERAGRPDAAERVLRAAVAASDAAAPGFALARLLGRRGRNDEMGAALAAAVARVADAADGALRAASVLLSLDPPRLAEARSELERAAATAGDPRAALTRLADIALLEAGRGMATPAAAAEAVARCVAAGVETRDRAYLDGKLALLEGRVDDAVRSFEEALGAGSRSAATLYYLARARCEAGRTGEATEALDRAAELAPDDRVLRHELSVLRTDLAAAALAAGRTSEALLLLEGAATTDRALLLLAGARASRADWDLARSQARAYVERQPRSRVGRHLLAAVLVRAGGEPRLREAAALFAALAAEDAEDAHAAVGLAATLSALGATAPAAAAWEAALGLAPSDPAVLRGALEALVGAGRASDALELAERALAAEPESVELLRLRADVLLHVGRLADAAEAYLRLAAVDRADVRPLVAAAAALMADGRADEARALLTARLPRCDDPRAGRLALGDLLARAGDVPAAREALTDLGGGAPPSSYAVLLVGAVAEAEGAVERARRIYATRSSDDDVRVAVLHRLSALLTAAGADRAALDANDAILRLAPDDDAAVNNRALLLARDDERLAEALAEARRALQLAPQRPEIADTLGWLLVRSGRPVAALPHLELAAKALGGDARVLFHLGVCYARLGHVDQARERLERALELDAAFPGADAARAQLDRLR